MSSLLLLFSAHSFIFPQKKKIVHIEDKREQRHCSLWELRKIIIHGPIILITVTRAGWLVLGQGVNFSKHLEASRNLCFARPPSTLVSGVLIDTNKRLFMQPLLGALSSPAITTTATKLPYKKPTKTAKKYWNRRSIIS